jgi:GH35 family endo-1,4-beta-xylanase
MGVFKPFALEGVAFKEDNGAKVLKDGDAVEFSGSPDAAAGSQAWTPIAPRSRVTFRAVGTPDARFNWNNFTLMVGGSTGQYVSGGVSSGVFKGSLTQYENAHKTVENKDGPAFAPKDAPTPLELTVDTVAKTAVIKFRNSEIKSDLKVDLGKIDKIGFSSYRTGATFRSIQLSPVSAEDLGLAASAGGGAPATPLASLGSYEKKLVAEELNALPAGNFALAPEQDAVLKALSTSGQARAETVAVTGQAFSKAIRVVAPDGVKKDNDAMITAFNTQPIRKGETIFFTWWHRVIESRDETRFGHGRLWFVPRGWSGPFMVAHDFTAVNEWRQARVAARANRDFAPGEAEMQLHFGYYPQTVEVGGFTAINFGPGVAPEDTPLQKVVLVDYEGRAADAPWRKIAAHNIDQHRKGTLQVLVTDARGKRVKDAKIEVRQQRHAFRWGTTTDIFPLLGITDMHGNRKYSPEMVARHNEFLKKTFNYIALENSLKEYAWKNEYGRFKREWGLQALKWLQENKFEIKGHVMHWGFRDVSPGMKPLLAANTPSPELREYPLAHIRDIGGATKDIVRTWDVINEHIGFHRSTDIFGKDYAVDLFKEAKKATDGARLFWTESETADPRHIEWARYLKSKGAPIDGLGFQGHFGVASLPGPQRIWNAIDKAGALGLDAEFTEVDVSVGDTQDKRQLQLRLDFLRDFMTAIFAHPRSSGLLFWTTFPSDWKPETAMLDEQMNLRPVGQTVREVITKTFWTNASGQLNARGEFPRAASWAITKSPSPQAAKRRQCERFCSGPDKP